VGVATTGLAAYVKAYRKKLPLSLWERVGVRASEPHNRLRKPAAIRATLTPDPSPAKRARGDYGIGFNRRQDLLVAGSCNARGRVV